MSLKSSAMEWRYIPAYLYFKNTNRKNQDLRNELSIVVVVIRVDVVLSVVAEVTQCLTVVINVNVDKVHTCPHFNADQHNVHILRLI